MKRLLASLSAVGLLASPVAAFAAPTAGEILMKVAMMTGGTSSTVELHGHADDVYFSVWASGSQQGKWMDPEARAKWKATVDVVQGDMKVRLKGQMRMFENTVYVKVDAVEGTMAELLSWNLMQKPWVQIPVDQGAMMMDAPLMMEDFAADPMIMDMLNTMFVMTEDRFPGGKKYVFTPSAELMGQMGMPEGAMMAMKIRVNTTNDWIANFAAVDVTMEDPSGMGLTLNATMQRTPGNVYVEVPAGAMTWEEFQWQLEEVLATSPLPEFPFVGDPMMDMPTPDEWPGQPTEWVPAPSEPMDDWMDWSTEEVEVPTWFDACDAEPGTPNYLIQMRKGLCPITGPAQGSRDERYRP